MHSFDHLLNKKFKIPDLGIKAGEPKFKGKRKAKAYYDKKLKEDLNAVKKGDRSE